MHDHITIVGRLFIAACAIISLILVTLVVVVAAVFISLDQGRKNQRHIDCIVASVSPRPPEYCVPVIDSLRDRGILRPTTTTQVP